MAPISTPNRRGVLRGGGGAEKEATHTKRPMTHTALEREKGEHGVLSASGPLYSDPSSPSTLPPASSSAWSPSAVVLEGRKSGWMVSGAAKGKPAKRGGKETDKWSPYRASSRGSGGRGTSRGHRPSSSSHVAFPPSRKGVPGSGGQGEEEDSAISLPTLLMSRRSYRKALQVAATAGTGSGGGKRGGTSTKRKSGTPQGSSPRAGSHDGFAAAASPTSKALEVYEGGSDTAVASVPPGYRMELEERVRLLDRQLGEARMALQDALVTVEHLRRENDTLRSLQLRMAEGRGSDDRDRAERRVARPTSEMTDQERSGASPDGASLASPSMELARLTAENSLLVEQKHLLREEVSRLQLAQQQSWETTQQEIATLTTQLHQCQHSVTSNDDRRQSEHAKWGQEKDRLERECHALRIRCTQTEADLTACRAGMVPPASSSYLTSPSSIPFPGSSAADGVLGLLGGNAQQASQKGDGSGSSSGSSGSSSTPNTSSGGGGGGDWNWTVVQEMRRKQAEETNAILQVERARWEEERTNLRRELSESQRALLQGTQEKYSLRFYTDRVQQLEGELSQKSSEVGEMEQQLLQALGALQSCQRDATVAVRQEVGQELSQLRQEVEEAHAARREKEKLMMEQREQLAEANRKAHQWSADVEMYKEMIEKYYAGVLDAIPGHPHGSAAAPGGQVPPTATTPLHRTTSSRPHRLPSGGRLPQGVDVMQGGGGGGHSPSVTSSPFLSTNVQAPSGLSSDELHRAYAVAALQKSSAKYTSLWSNESGLSPSLRVGSDGPPMALSAEAKAPLQLFEALQWDEKWEAKQLREALATAALDVELAVQQSQQERTQAEHFREQLAHMTKERDVLLEENIEMRRRLRHVQTVFAKQQMHAYRDTLKQRVGGGSVVSAGVAYARGERPNEGAGGVPLPIATHGSPEDEKELASSGAMTSLPPSSLASHGQVDILLRSMYLEDAVLPLLQFTSTAADRHQPTSLFFTLDGLLGYGTMLSPSFYSVEEGLSDVLFQYAGLSPDTLTMEEIQRTTLVLQLHHAFRGDTKRKREKDKKAKPKGFWKSTPFLQKATNKTSDKDDEDESEDDDDDDDDSMQMTMEGGIEGGSEIIAQAELPGAWLLQASEMVQEATLDLISGGGDVVGHVMMEFSCHHLLLPISLGLPLRSDIASSDGKAGKLTVGVDHGMVLSASEVKAALVALRSVIAIRIQVFRLEGITARVPAPTSGGDTAASMSSKKKKTGEEKEKDAGGGKTGDGMREVSPYVFYTTNSALPAVSAIRDTVVRPTAVHRHRAEEEEEDASASEALLSATFESAPTEHRVAADRDLIHFLCYSSVAFVVFDEHEEDVSHQLGMIEIPLRSLLDSPQAFIREVGVLHPRGKLTVGLSWRSL